LTASLHVEGIFDRITSRRGDIWVHKTNLTPPLSIEVSVPSQESEMTCIFCVMGIDFSSFYDFGV
jgi:hypothetical protein